MPDMPWEDSDAAAEGASRGGSWRPGGEHSREEIIERLVFDYRDLMVRITDADLSQGKTELIEVDDGYGGYKVVERPTQLASLMASAEGIDKRLQSYGVDLDGLPLDNPSKISASVAAQLANSAADRASREALGYAGIASDERRQAAELDVRQRLATQGDAATARENALTRASNERQAKESLAQRYTDSYITAVTDILDSEIRRGNLSVSEAEQRRAAATSAAQIQADLLTNLGGYQVAPGAQYFPGLGPNDPAAQIAQGMGFAPPTMGIGGTFTVSPGKMVDPIYGALAGMQGSGIAANAMQDATGRLGALGVPLNGAPSRQQGVGMDPIAAALAAGG